jgi:replication factor A1
MRSWYDSTGHAAETKNMSAGGGAGGGGARGPNTENRKTFEFAKAEGVPKGGAREVNLYNNVATITYFKHDGTVAYPSCPETKKKLVEINENCWRCEATGKEYPEPQWRYCMSMKAEDSSGHSWVTAFDDTAKMILGVDAKQMMELKNAGEADPAKQAEFAAVFDNVVGTDFVFRCVLKEDTYQDETRLKTSLLAADKMDYAAESRHILSTFKAAGICA